MAELKLEFLGKGKKPGGVFHGGNAVAELKLMIRRRDKSLLEVFHGGNAVAELKPDYSTCWANIRCIVFHGGNAVAELKRRTLAHC